MKVAFVRPCSGGCPSPEAMEPLAFAALLAVTPDDLECELYDEMVEGLPGRIEADLVAMSVQTFTAARAYELSDEIRARGIQVVMGGHHPSALPQEALRHADAVVVGAGESVWPTLLADAKRGQLKPLYHGGSEIGTGGYDRSLFRGKGYLPVRNVEFHRGCRWSCDFCSVPVFQPDGPVGREPLEVAEEMRREAAKNFLIVDDNLLSDEAKLREFLALIEPLGIRWGCQISLEAAWRGDLLERMSRSGCTVALIGFESMDPVNLGLMKKGANRSKQSYAGAVQRFHDSGIFVYGSFLFGYDADTSDTMKRSLEFSLENQFFLANFNTLTPMPGTPLYNRLKKEGRLLEEQWWLDPHYGYGEVMFRPHSMSPEELKSGCLELRRQFHRFSSMFGRMPSLLPPGEILFRHGLFWTANLIARRSIEKKMEQVVRRWNSM